MITDRLFLTCLKFTVFAWLVVSTNTMAAENRSQVDSLLRVDQEQLKELRKTLAQLLFVTPADCARMLVRPSSEPEFAVAVYSHGDGRYHVSTTVASTSIWLAQEKSPEAISNIRVKCWDAPIPSSTARAINRLWKKILDHVGEANLPPNYLEPLDGTIVEFSVKQAGQEKTGELPPEPGKRLEALEKLGRVLSEYPKFPNVERSAIAERLERDATALLKSDREEGGRRGQSTLKVEGKK